MQFVTVFFRNLMLQLFNFLILKFDDFAGLDADHVIMVSATVQFKHGMT